MLLIFDCDGVVVDSMLNHSKVEAEAYKKHGISISPEELSRRFAGVPQPDVSKILEQETGCIVPPDFKVDKINNPVFSEGMKAMPNLDQAIADLADTPRCIASGSGMRTLEYMLKLVGLYEKFFPHVFSSSMVAKGKPAPDLFLYAADKMGFAPSDCVVIEDGIAGVQGGKAAGMRVLGFIGGSHCDAAYGDALKQAGADLVFSDMEELASLLL